MQNLFIFFWSMHPTKYITWRLEFGLVSHLMWGEYLHSECFPGFTWFAVSEFFQRSASSSPLSCGFLCLVTAKQALGFRSGDWTLLSLFSAFGSVSLYTVSLSRPFTFDSTCCLWIGTGPFKNGHFQYSLTCLDMKRFFLLSRKDIVSSVDIIKRHFWFIYFPSPYKYFNIVPGICLSPQFGNGFEKLVPTHSCHGNRTEIPLTPLEVMIAHHRWKPNERWWWWK